MTKIKAFLKKWIINNIGFKILALVFAFVLWLVILNTTDTETTRTISNIPVTIENEAAVLDGTHVYTIETGETATVVVSGKRSVVNTLNPSDFSAVANFAELSITNAVPIKVELTGDKARYANSVTVNQKTMSMVINLEDVTERVFDVQVVFKGETPKNLIVEDASTTPAMVTLTAPESIVNRVDRIVVEVDAAEITGDVQLQLAPVIYDFNGRIVQQNTETYLNHDLITVNVTTETTKLVPISITPIGTPDEKSVLNGISYSKTGVTLKGSADVIQGIDTLELPGELLNIEGAKEDVKITVNLADYLPYGVSIYGDTSSITITASITRQKEIEN
ncbi:MAG: hypothetical protein J5483_01735 [Lachnospiraceae bacterium]|nr:hypothetical protein [Lachnospiraceae bacterium]